MKIIGISGSLRKKSFNTGLLKFMLAEFERKGCQTEMLAIDDFPLYNPDNKVDAEEVVSRGNALVSGADLVVFAVPEYNHSIPGPLKNAIEWLSEPYMNSAFKGKKVAIIGAAPSPVGSARAVAHMKLIMASMLSEIFPARDFLVPFVQNKVNANGEPADEDLIHMVQNQVRGLMAWVSGG